VDATKLFDTIATAADLLIIYILFVIHDSCLGVTKFES
jgi:hypothetical protein